MSDAGTPLVSDPGYKLVREAAQQGAAVYSIPGASAPLAALASSGLPTDCFTFAGFPPPRSSARRTFLKELGSIRGTLIFFEGPSRLVASLADMAVVLGGARRRRWRELTKKLRRRGADAGRAGGTMRRRSAAGDVVLVGPGGSS
jgi:16S rRNA (cytidine1402-2'-O)-methyltransferase